VYFVLSTLCIPYWTYHFTGDVDILILPPEGEESCVEVLQPLLDALKAQHFLTDDLTLKYGLAHSRTVGLITAELC
jgi:DNA polymerase beta palm